MPPGMMLRSKPWFIVRLWRWWLSLSGKQRVEVVGIAVVAAYTTVAYGQLRALRRSTDAEVATVRAWVYPVDVKPPPPAEIQLNGKFPIEFRNGGKLPRWNFCSPKSSNTGTGPLANRCQNFPSVPD
jgi:hypothetical protein